MYVIICYADLIKSEWKSVVLYTFNQLSYVVYVKCVP